MLFSTWISNKLQHQPLACARAKRILLLFYRNCIHTDRDASSGLPLDPITQEAIPKERQICIWNSIEPSKKRYNQRITYFDAMTLHMWFMEAKEGINPITNLPFTKEQIQTIYNAFVKQQIQPMPSFMIPKSSKIKMKEPPISAYALKRLFTYARDNFKKFMIVWESLTPEQQETALHFKRHITPSDSHPLCKYVVSESLLFNAIYYGNVCLVEFLLEEGADPYETDLKTGVNTMGLALESTSVFAKLIVDDLILYQNSTS
jgi:hypothetical protein